MKHTVPKVACINDLSGYGRCSLSTAIPILSVCGVQPCAVPTAVLSKHTGFEDYYFTDLTDSLVPFFKSWDNLDFDGIYTGFLGSVQQIYIVEDFIKLHKNRQPKPPVVIVDTVMGDNGRLYSTYTEQMCEALKSLVALADVITPNVTEACFLTQTDYKTDELTDDECRILAQKLKSLGALSVVITGIRRNESVLNYICTENVNDIYEVHRTNHIFSGTGDLFSSVLTAFLVREKSLYRAVEAASQFVSKTTEYTLGVTDDFSQGVIFEPFLKNLGGMI